MGYFIEHACVKFCEYNYAEFEYFLHFGDFAFYSVWELWINMIYVCIY